jgi:hypothetical protein
MAAGVAVRVLFGTGRALKDVPVPNRLWILMFPLHHEHGSWHHGLGRRTSIAKLSTTFNNLTADWTIEESVCWRTMNYY